jgi:hypothetical protein
MRASHFLSFAPLDYGFTALCMIERCCAIERSQESTLHKITNSLPANQVSFGQNFRGALWPRPSCSRGPGNHARARRFGIGLNSRLSDQRSKNPLNHQFLGRD